MRERKARIIIRNEQELLRAANLMMREYQEIFGGGKKPPAHIRAAFTKIRGGMNIAPYKQEDTRREDGNRSQGYDYREHYTYIRYAGDWTVVDGERVYVAEWEFRNHYEYHLQLGDRHLSGMLDALWREKVAHERGAE
ncbi:MAG: hypothetical protein VB111_03155 [Clostridiaceae bacterium]|nr:hypothetical protein [Clostridiaceae bacterium]